MPAGADNSYNPYTLPNTGMNQGVGSIDWYDFDEHLRERMLGEAHPAKTVSVEFVAPDSTVTRYQFTRERKRILGPDLLRISITRRADTADARTHTWHSISRMRLHFFRQLWYDFTFVGKVADDEERARGRRLGFMQRRGLAIDEKIFYPPYTSVDFDNWMWPRRVYETQGHVFEELGLTLHRIRDEAGEEVLEYRF